MLHLPGLAGDCILSPLFLDFSVRVEQSLSLVLFSGEGVLPPGCAYCGLGSSSNRAGKGGLLLQIQACTYPGHSLAPQQSTKRGLGPCTDRRPFYGLWLLCNTDQGRSCSVPSMMHHATSMPGGTSIASISGDSIAFAL